MRSAEELNAAIRALWPHPAVRLSDAQRAEYEVLVAEWTRVSQAEALRGDIAEAA
ncbi:hypothetical protein [Streptomyces luteocolor]|uniref:hypothetical protein n=1 Tax=Streptomyces luteocolor TaxID=285500 RepID=UPI00350E5B2B